MSVSRLSLLCQCLSVGHGRSNPAPWPAASESRSEGAGGPLSPQSGEPQGPGLGGARRASDGSASVCSGSPRGRLAGDSARARLPPARRRGPAAEGGDQGPRSREDTLRSLDSGQRRSLTVSGGVLSLSESRDPKTGLAKG